MEVRWRDDRGLSVKVVTFDNAAESYIASLKRQAKLDGKPLAPRDEKKIRGLEHHLLPHFKGTPLSSIDGKAVGQSAERRARPGRAARPAARPRDRRAA